MPVWHSIILPVKGLIEQLFEKKQPVHLDRNSITYLESNPKGIDASSPIGQCRSLVPDVRQMFIPREQVNEWIKQRALVLVTGHYEVIYDQWRKYEQEKDACQGKPVHLPVIQNRAFCFPAFSYNSGLIQSGNFFSGPSRLTGWKLKMFSGHIHFFGSNSYKKLNTLHTLAETVMKLC